MTIDRMKATINNPRTTSAGLEILYYSEDLPVELIALMARHENIKSELLGAIFNNDGANPEVALAVASRVSLLTFYPLRAVACAIRDNTFEWSRQEQEQIFEAFRDNLPKEGHHVYGYWRTNSFEEICPIEDEDEEEFDEEEELLKDEGDFEDLSQRDYPSFPDSDTKIDYDYDEDE